MSSRYCSPSIRTGIGMTSMPSSFASLCVMPLLLSVIMAVFINLLTPLVCALIINCPGKIVNNIFLNVDKFHISGTNCNTGARIWHNLFMCACCMDACSLYAVAVCYCFLLLLSAIASFHGWLLWLPAVGVGIVKAPAGAGAVISC